MTSVPLNRIRRVLALILILIVGTSISVAAPQDDGITTSHGFAVYGELKYPAGYRHMDYANPDAPKGGSYRYANPGTFDSFNTYALTGTAPFAIIYIYDSLMRQSADEEGSFYGVIAETIRYPSDLAWVEFTLHPKARWHDGRPITVEDVIFTTNLFKTYKHPVFGQSAGQVVRAEKVGPRTVRYTLAEKNNRALVASLAQAAILPRHVWEKHDISLPSLDVPVGSGPYKVGRFSPGRWIELERVKDYWAADLPVNRGRWNFDILRHDFYRDPAVINEAFLAGDTDLRTDNNATRWRFEATLPPFRGGLIKRDRVQYESAALMQMLWMNARRPFFRDVRVRQAMELAYDFEWVQRVLLQGPHGRYTSYFANTPFAAEGLPTPGERRMLEPFRAQLPPEMFTRPPLRVIGGDRRKQRQNLVRAAALLKAAGYRIVDGRLVDPRTGRPIVLEFALASQTSERQISLFRQNLERLGIQTNMRFYDSAEMRFTVAGQHNFDFTISIPFPIVLSSTPGVELIGSLGSQGAQMAGSLNIPGISEPAIDTLIQQVIAARDRQTVVDAMRAIDRVLQWKHYGILFYHTYPAPTGELPIVYWDRFGRPPVEPVNNFPVFTMDHWWVDPEKDARIRRALGGRG
jgi:microcin C transport system substrate-binding protein